MKICIIGHPRTRSSLLLEVLMFYYNIPILGEDVNKLGEYAYAFQRYDGEQRDIPSKYRLVFLSVLKGISSAKEGVVRLHPTQLSCLSYNSKMFNLDILNLRQYDKIYLTTRKNVPELVSSLFVAHKLKTFTYRNKDEVFTDVGPFTLEPDLYFQTIEMLLYSEFIMDEVKKYLTRHSIEWVELDYDDIPNHVETNYSGVKSNHVETDYDYPKIVTNYNQIQPLYEQLKTKVYNHFCNDNRIDK